MSFQTKHLPMTEAAVSKWLLTVDTKRHVGCSEAAPAPLWRKGKIGSLFGGYHASGKNHVGIEKLIGGYHGANETTTMEITALPQNSENVHRLNIVEDTWTAQC